MKKQTIKRSATARLLHYIAERNKTAMAIVVVSIIVSVVAGLAASVFMQIMIDDYILKMVETGEDLFDKFYVLITVMAVVLIIGILCTWIYNRTMAIVAQKVLKDIRDDLFAKMETLPIKFFDTHTHGDIMSVYTNDTDTLRQLIAQSLPSLLLSVVTFVFTFCMMI